MLILNGEHSDYNPTKSLCNTGKGKEIQQITCATTPPSTCILFQSCQEQIAEEYISYVATKSTLAALSLNEIAKATVRDLPLQAVMEAVRTDKWHVPTEWPYINPNTYSSFANIKGKL